jgi:hypothetical protein
LLGFYPGWGKGKKLLQILKVKLWHFNGIVIASEAWQSRTLLIIHASIRDCFVVSPRNDNSLLIGFSIVRLRITHRSETNSFVN